MPTKKTQSQHVVTAKAKVQPQPAARGKEDVRPPLKISPPDQLKLSELQSKRLANLTGLDTREFIGTPIGAVIDKIRWIIDPPFSFFRRICGQVVRKDPVSGVEYPVPFATVHVEDTDCNLIAYFPPGWRWGWFYPLFCRREEIATVRTDECGRFCVWVPWFDIDWILRWRRERICFPDIFIRPKIRDLIPIEDIPPVVGGPFPPGPDPDPILRLTTVPSSLLSRLSAGATRYLPQLVGAVQASRAFGGQTPPTAALGEERAFTEELPPPLPREGSLGEPGGKRGEDSIREGLAARLNVDVKALAQFDPQRYIGPFFRCIDVFVPEWSLLIDVPDITFRVTQDTNNDGTEETIYSESYFDVRWDAGPLPNVKLYAGPSALVSHTCGVPSVPCGNQPALLFVGLMPLTNPGGGDPYHDAATGYAKRPNRPHASGNIAEPPPYGLASIPYARTLQLYGCVEIQGASFYRVQYSTDGGTSFTPFVGLSWPLNRALGGPPWQIWPTSDANGWYPIIPASENWFPPNLVLEWPTSAAGEYILRLELGDGAKNVIAPAAPDVAFRIDNTAPSVVFDKLAWKFTTESDAAFNLPGRSLLGICPTIHRGAVPQAVQVLMQVTVNALHLRHGTISASGCGGGSPSLVADPSNHTEHWHTDPSDNAEQFYARFQIDAGDLEGAYHFACYAASRAFNPAGHDNGHLSDWNDPPYEPIEIYTNPAIAVAIVNSN